MKIITDEELELAVMKMTFWRKYREGDQLILPKEKRKVGKKAGLEEEQKIGAVLEKKRL